MRFSNFKSQLATWEGRELVTPLQGRVECYSLREPREKSSLVNFPREEYSQADPPYNINIINWAGPSEKVFTLWQEYAKLLDTGPKVGK